MDDVGVNLLPGSRSFDSDAKPAPYAPGSLENGLPDFFDSLRNLLDVERNLEPEDIVSSDDRALSCTLRQEEMGKLMGFEKGITTNLPGG